MSSTIKFLTLSINKLKHSIIGTLSASCFLLISLNQWLTDNILVSVILLSVFVGLILAIMLVWKHFERTLKPRLQSISQLEKWADMSTVCNDIKPVPAGSDSLTKVITSLQKEYLNLENNNNQFDTILRRNALLDKETGIGNRDFFNNRLEALLKEEDIQGGIYFIQFRELDLVESLYGRHQANHLLTSIIQRVKYSLRDCTTYFIARRSEHELALIVPDLFFTEAEKLATKLMAHLSKISLPNGINEDEFIHIGVSYFSQADKAYQIKSEADMALRSAQLQGPSQWFMYDPGEVEYATAKGSLKWRTFLTNALNKSTFVLFFQPVISAENEQIVHHEILSKVRDADGSLINARVFLPMAKKCGLSKEVDLLVLEQACRVLSYDDNHTDSCSLNLSIDALLSSHFIEKFKQILSSYPNIQNRLIIELSEYHLVHHLTQLKPTLELLNKLGIKLLADKVGQHVVSAQYLKECPIQYIKLHRSIVLNVHIKPENQIFIRSLKAISDVNHVSIFALGVENLEEWKALKKLGVSGGQGHYFTEPVAEVAKAIHMP